MKKETNRVECPFCKGFGYYLRPVKYGDNLRKKAIKLYKEGNGFRKIGRILKIPHPQSVKWLILKKR